MIFLSLSTFAFLAFGKTEITELKVQVDPLGEGLFSELHWDDSTGSYRYTQRDSVFISPQTLVRVTLKSSTKNVWAEVCFMDGIGNLYPLELRKPDTERKCIFDWVVPDTIGEGALYFTTALWRHYDQKSQKKEEELYRFGKNDSCWALVGKAIDPVALRAINESMFGGMRMRAAGVLSKVLLEKVAMRVFGQALGRVMLENSPPQKLLEYIQKFGKECKEAERQLLARHAAQRKRLQNEINHLQKRYKPGSSPEFFAKMIRDKQEQLRRWEERERREVRTLREHCESQKEYLYELYTQKIL